jgi:hypothetical protein
VADTTAVCMSRHLNRVGMPRPPVEWVVTYGCAENHSVSTEVCGPCAESLVDGRQRCARCFRVMVVGSLHPLTAKPHPSASGTGVLRG